MSVGEPIGEHAHAHDFEVTRCTDPRCGLDRPPVTGRGRIHKPTVWQRLGLLLTGRQYTRDQEAALLRWHAGPDADADQGRARRPTT